MNTLQWNHLEGQIAKNKGNISIPTFILEGGKWLSVIGPSGSGKSSFLRMFFECYRS